MRPGVPLLLFAVILAAATSISFLGYRFLSLASDLRERNFQQMVAAQGALDLLAKSPILRPNSTKLLATHLADAREQVLWCLNSLSYFETLAFNGFGGQDTRRSCHRSLTLVDRALDQSRPMLASDALNKKGPNSPFATNLQITETVYALRMETLVMQPFLKAVELQIERMVIFVTVVASIILSITFLFISRQMFRSWKVQVRQTLEIRRITQRFSRAAGCASDGFAIFDVNNCLLESNEKYRELSHSNPKAIRRGMSMVEIMNSAIESGFYVLSGQSSNEMVDAYHARLREKGFVAEAQLEVAGDRHVLVKVNETEFGEKVVTRTEITSLIRSARKQQEAAEALRKAKDKIEVQALTDPLTGLANRRCLDLQLAERLQQGPTSLIRIDLDRFKKVNDILGHEAGDFVLCHVASILRSQARKDDLLARVGGDEFVVLCGAQTPIENARDLAQRLLKKVLEPVEYDNKRCHYGASFGIAAGTSDTVTPSELLNNADLALYRAKSTGRATVEVFTDRMRQAAQEERDLADRFISALENGEIVPFFQTQHDAQTWEISGVEVLARWQHPERGLLAPGRFLGIAKQLGKEAELDEVIFEAAVKTVNNLDQHGLFLPRTSINVSAARMMDPSFLAKVRTCIPEDRERYAFEILESISYEDASEGLILAIDTLKELGFGVDVDDFGSGHASINGVLNLEPDVLKIDRNIIMPLEESDRAQRMVASILELARSLGVKVIAEGVDSKSKALFLREVGCDMLQGYYFSRPMPENDLRAKLLEQLEKSKETDTTRY